MKKKGYARVKVELDSFRPLIPGVLIGDDDDSYWQQFQYENISMVCFLYGLLDHINEECPMRCLEPVVDASGAGDLGAAQPRLGPWHVTSCICQQWEAPTFVRGSKDVPTSSGVSPGSSGPTSSSPHRPSPVPSSSPPSSPPDMGGWQKPTKVARRSNVGRGAKDIMKSVEDSRFQLLSRVPALMEVQTSSPAITEAPMLDQSTPVLKHARSPSPETPMPNLQPALVPVKGSKPGRCLTRITGRVSSPIPSARVDQVCRTDPCMLPSSAPEPEVASEMPPSPRTGLVDILIGESGHWPLADFGSTVVPEVQGKNGKGKGVGVRGAKRGSSALSEGEGRVRIGKGGGLAEGRAEFRKARVRDIRGEVREGERGGSELDILRGRATMSGASA